MTNIMWRQEGVKFQTAESDERSSYAVPIPNDALREASSVSELGFWYSIGEAWSQTAAYFIPEFARSSPLVVDIGCGCGKMARFFVINPAVRFVGIDVFKPAIDWCRTAFSGPYAERFQFKHLNVYSKLYNQSGAEATNATQLPVEDACAHMVICGSLFTHLLENELHIYLREIARIMAPGGRMIASTHNQPATGTEFSGAVERIDMTDAYFLRACQSVRLDLFKKIGTIYGQEVFIMERS